MTDHPQPYGAPSPPPQYGAAPQQYSAAPQQYAAQQWPQSSPPPPRKSNKALIGWLAGGIPALLIVAFLAVGTIMGFSNAYETEVVDQEAQAETFRTELTGEFDVVMTENRICGDGQDYLDCINWTQETVDENCIAGTVTAATQYLCDDYEAFIKRAKSTYATCGTDCVTVAEPDGSWGYPELERVEVTEQVSNNDAKEYKSHIEKCDFDFLFVKIGYCPGPDVGVDRSKAD